MALACLVLLARPRPGRIALAVCGVFLSYLSFLYLRYLPLALVVGSLAFVNGRSWRSPWLVGTAGMCLITEAALTWHVYHAVPTAISSGAYLVSTHDVWERFCRLFFDRGQGIAPEQPVLLFAFWAAPFLVRRLWSDLRFRFAAVAIIPAGAYSIPFALLNANAGESAPGRYLSATTPLFLVGILHWALRGDRFDRSRLRLVLAVWGVSLAIIIEGIVARTLPWLAMLSYQRWFPFGWGPASVVVSDRFVQGESATYGVLLLLGAWLTKSLASEAVIWLPVPIEVPASAGRARKPIKQR